MNRRSIILTLGLLIAGWLAFFSDKPGDGDIVEPVKRASTSASAASRSAVANVGNPANAGNGSKNSANASPNTSSSTRAARASARAIAILALQDRSDLLGQNTLAAPALNAPAPTDTKKSTSDKKAAAKDKPMPIPVDTVVAQALFDSQTWNPPPPPPPKPTPPPPPVAPPLPYIVLGKKSEGQQWEVYLARGDQTFIAREKETLENQYRVDSIKPPTMVLTYLPLNQVQTLSIGGFD
jgi:hypothetical protein